MIARWPGFVWLVVAFSLALAAGPGSSRAQGAKLRVLILTGQNNHNWRQTTPHLKRLLEVSERFTVDVTEDPATFMAAPDSLKPYDVLLLNYNGPRWGEAAEKTFLDAVRGGKGVVVIHAANNAFPGWTDYEKLIGIAWRSTAGHGAYHEFTVKFVDRNHPISKDLADLQAHPDELYHRLTPAPDEPFTVLATAYSDPAKGGTGKDEPMVLVKTFGKGRVFHTALGHDLKSMSDLGFMLLVARGTEWAGSGKVTVLKAPAAP